MSRYVFTPPLITTQYPYRSFMIFFYSRVEKLYVVACLESRSCGEVVRNYIDPTSLTSHLTHFPGSIFDPSLLSS